MKRIKKRGYMWRCYGFTKTHIWGVNITSGLCAGLGSATLTAALILVGKLPAEVFYKLISISACAVLGCIAVTLGSILSLSFYSGAHKLDLLEKNTETEQDIGQVSSETAVSDEPSM